MGCVSCAALMKELAGERDADAQRLHEADAVPAGDNSDAPSDGCSGAAAPDISPAGDRRS